MEQVVEKLFLEARLRHRVSDNFFEPYFRPCDAYQKFIQRDLVLIGQSPVKKELNAKKVTCALKNLEKEKKSSTKW